MSDTRRIFLTQSINTPNLPPLKWLPRVRRVWLGIIILLFAVFVASIPDTYHVLTTVCYTSLEECHTWGQPVPRTIEILDQYHISLQVAALYHLVLYVLVSLVFWAAGLMVLWYRRDTWHSLLVSYLLITIGAGGVSFIFMSDNSWTDILAVVAIINAIMLMPMYLAFSLFFLSFPNGRVYPHWTWVGIGLIFANYAAWLAPGQYNILTWSPIVSALWIVFVFGSHVSIQIYRYKKFYTPSERQQTKWLVYGFSLTLMGLVIATGLNELTQNALDGMLQGTFVAFSYLPIAIAVTIAILRYRLWDIDVFINRTLVYGVLSALIVSLYILIVGGSSLFVENRTPHVSILATALVAIGFQPARERVQLVVNRLTYGDRDEPYKVIAQLSRRLGDTLEYQTILSTIVETIAQALKLPYVAIALEQDVDKSVVVAEYGRKIGHSDLVSLPIVHSQQRLGALYLAPRSPHEVLTPRDMALLNNLVWQVGTAIQAVMLNMDLQRSRQRIVTEREEARRQLGSDLHDGIGHRLASLVRRVDLVEGQIDNAPQAVESLAEIKVQLKNTIDEVRSLAHSLHPPELELLGLDEAIQERVRQYHDEFEITLAIQRQLPKLPIAVEVAAYYILQELLTNISRHAQATACTICLQIEQDYTDKLILDVQDNGIGIEDVSQVNGLGLISIRKRAAELGGSVHIAAVKPHGTHITIKLPCQ